MMIRSTAEIVREYGPFGDASRVHGVSYDGQRVWFASGDKLNAFDPESGDPVRSIDVAAHAGTAFDGQHLFQIARIASRRLTRRAAECSPQSLRPAVVVTRGWRGPKGRCGWDSIETERSFKLTPTRGDSSHDQSNRFVTGVTWVDGELWHATWEGDESDLRRVDPQTGDVLERLDMPSGVYVSGLESDGGNKFFCGGGSSGKVRAVSRPKRGSTRRRAFK